MSHRDICEHIVKAGIAVRNRRTGAIARTAEEIWNASPGGELFHVYELYEAASEILGVFADGSPYIPIVSVDSSGNFIRATKG